jgi:hypothetical protein
VYHTPDAWIGRDVGELGVVHFCNLAISTKPPSSGGSLSKHAHIGVTVELNDHTGAAEQLPRTVAQDAVQLVATLI